ncbi:hypothetical protein HK405_014628, partial [Cladochytrium tenue]
MMTFGFARRRTIFIQTDTTPSADSLRFRPGVRVLPDPPAPTTSSAPGAAATSAEFLTQRDAAARSPLARRLFRVDGVRGVLLGPDFVTVTKAADAHWAPIKPDVYAAIMDHFASGQPAVLPDPDPASSAAESAASSTA